MEGPIEYLQKSRKNQFQDVVFLNQRSRELNIATADALAAAAVTHPNVVDTSLVGSAYEQQTSGSAPNERYVFEPPMAA